MFDRGGGTGAADPRQDPRMEALAAASRGADTFILNLETTIGSGSKPEDKEFLFRSPATALGSLSLLPRPVACIANNHSMDWGRPGLVSTLEALDAAGILHAGGGRDPGEARTPARVTAAGGGIFVFARGFDNDSEAYAGPGAAIAPLRLGDLAPRIAACRAGALAVVVMLHWGEEYDLRYDEGERSFARACVDAGADLVVGSGPHVIQGVESYKGALICYSLGNLVFDDLGSEETATSLLVRISVIADRKGRHERTFALAPLRTRRVDDGPRALNATEARRAMAALALRSPDPRFLEEANPSLEDGILWFMLPPP